MSKESGDEPAQQVGAPTSNTPVRPVVRLTEALAVGVAREILVLADRLTEAGYEPVLIDECWVGEDLAIYIRYTSSFNPVAHAGQRIPNASIDLTSGGYAQDDATQAQWFLHDLQGPAVSVWTDPLGYDWASYDPQPDSWEYSVEQLPRLATVKERSGASG